MTTRMTVIGEKLGDGEIVAALPSFLQGMGRGLAALGPRSTRRRLNRAIHRLYPRIQTIESLVMPRESHLLQTVSVDEALSDPDRTERGWSVFQAAWKAGLVILRDLDGNPIAHGKNGLETACCGMSMDDVEEALVAIAAEHMFAGNELALEKVGDALGGLKDLPKLRIIAEFDALRLDLLREAFGNRFEEIIFGMELEHLKAFSHLRPHALHALRQAMGKEFIEVTEWEPDYVNAIADSFRVVEQFRDLGPYIVTVKSASTIRAIGSWEIRDVTDRMNATRTKQGKQRLKGRRFETDIAVVRHVLGKHFEELLERPTELVDAIGRACSTTRFFKGAERAARYQHVAKLTSRYMEYITLADMVKALRMTEDNPVMRGDTDDENVDLSFGEALLILDGLWNKKGYGRPFFEGPFQQEKGVKAISGLVETIQSMKKRGSVKGGEIDKILASTELLDASLRGVFQG
ncbi:MAG: hypothetical protein K9H25_06365 [Rhodospirillum sp.]|nr:hypothetical protein [Rhodospirillum sp.]MCF8489037.1 hypothetical protein [Rhodospirillum sp.]MCF8499774.1 hypothetical protein [Rhodospirillum sp.]